MNIREVLKNGIEKLNKNNIEDASLKAKMLLSEILEMKKEYLLIHEEEIMDVPDINTFFEKIDRLVNNEPIQYILNRQDFMGLNLYVDNAEKADALSRMIPVEKSFGTVTLEIAVIPSNKVRESKSFFSSSINGDFDLLRAAFKGNNSVANIVKIDTFTNPFIYVIFKPEVVQYFTDSLNDAHGLCSTLNQEIAKNIFEPVDCVYYCTDKIEKPVKCVSSSVTVSGTPCLVSSY